MDGVFYFQRFVGRNSCAQQPQADNSLLDFRFLEDHVLAYNRVIFLKLKLFSRVTRVFLGDIVKAGIRRAYQFDQDAAWLGHG